MSIPIQAPESKSEPTLHRTLGFYAVLAYGVGDILGAGIYALVGEVAATAGTRAWMSFGVTLIVAGITALSYAELASRIPEAGGEASYTYRAYRRPSISFITGWIVLCSGLVSCATVSIAFSGYVMESLSLESGRPVLILLFVVFASGVGFWGIRQSSATNIVCTVIEVTGLILVVVLGARFLMAPSEGADPLPTTAPPMDWSLLLQGSTLAFFAFLGFEDIVNITEETKSPRRTIPAAILTALLTAGVMYVVVAAVATAVVGPEVLAASKAPLLEVIRIAAPEFPLGAFSLIAIFAVANTGLLNLIMCSRLLYGMSKHGLVPKVLGRVHPKTRTPHWALLVLAIIVVLLAFTGTLRLLAGTTNVLILLVFALVHGALIVLKRRGAPDSAEDIFTVPAIVPWLGAVCCLALIAFAPEGSFRNALVVIGIGAGVGLAAMWRGAMDTAADDPS